MNITKYLNLVFKTTEDSTSTIKIPKVKEDVTEEEIKNCGKVSIKRDKHKEELYHIQHINALHSNLKKWMNRFNEIYQQLY